MNDEFDRDLVVRDRDKHKKTKAKDAGFHSTNDAQEIEDRLTNKMAMASKELAVATEETTNRKIRWPRPFSRSPRKWPTSRKRGDAAVAVAAMEPPRARPGGYQEEVQVLQAPPP